MVPTQNGSPRLPPHNQEAERSVLGSMMRDNSCIGDVVQILHRAELFYGYAHQEVFKAITYLAVEKGHPADAVTLANYLKEKQVLEDVGGYAYLGDLWDAAPSAANAEYYARIVRDKAITRDLIHACSDIERDSYDQIMPSDQLLDAAERRILEVAQEGVAGTTVTLQHAIREACDRIDHRKQHDHLSLSGVSTGYIDLDELTAGFQNSELAIIAARPSVGKTSFALNIVRHVAVEEDLPILFVSLEQSRIELAERLLCCQARVDTHLVRKGQLNSETMNKLITAGEVLRGAKVFLDDTPGLNMLRIAANARRLKLRHKLRLVVIDYLQLIEPDNRRDNRQEQVAAISRRLKFLARELAIPVVALAQLNRGSEEHKDGPRLSDLRESGSIEQDADTVILLHRPEDLEPGQNDGLIKVLVEKQRNGPTGRIELKFDKKYMRFENAAPQHFVPSL